jgi:hypothetical protein
MVSTKPFMIVDSDQAADRVGRGLPDRGTGPSVTGFADPSATGIDDPHEPGSGPRYRYEGPLGPIVLSHLDAPPRTRLVGPSIPDSSFDLGAPDQTDAVLLKRRLAAGIDGRVGDSDVRIVRDATTGAIHLDVEEGR